MKKIKRVISMFLCLMMLTGLFGVFGVTANAYNTGDFIWYGSYPQSRVTDTAVINAFGKMNDLTWTSLGCYSGNGSFGSAAAGSFVKYADFFYGTDRYRAVNITGYRPRLTHSPTGAAYSNVDDNGYTVISGYSNTTYLFKWEPIKWRVLNPSTGLVISESVIDAQAFHNTPYSANSKYYTDSSERYYANEFIGSSVRSWLNNDFYSKAFTATQKNNIKSANVTQYSNKWLDDYVSPSVSAKVFPLVYGHVTNSALGFDSSTSNSSTRLAVATDYAKCMGVTVSSSGYSPWLLSSYYVACGGSTSDSSKYCGSSDCVSINGGLSSDVVHNLSGVRPGMYLETLKNDTNLTSQSFLTVSFEPYSGMITDSSPIYVYNGSYYGTLPVCYISSALIFSGWYTAGNKKVTSSTKVAATVNHTLYADYEPATIKVTLNPNGGTVSTTTLNITNSLDSTVYPSLPTPTYPGGATFLGWYTKDGYQAKAGEKLTDRHDPTLYAQWKLNNITVTFDPQGGTVSPTSKVIEAGKPYGTLPVPTRPGYVFEGWVRSATSHSFVNASTSAGTANHTLYAVWTQAAAVKIRGYVASRKVDFRTTITFTAQPENAPANVEFYWYVNGERQGDNQQSITLGEVRDDFEIQVLMRTADNDIFVYSEKEKVEVKKGFFDKFTAFFKGLFHILPVINQ